MENKNNNIFLGKIEKSGCFVNNGKYGYFLTCGKKNYKIPEWLNPDEVTIDMAKRLIDYKQKISEEWFEKKNNENKNDESDKETSEEPVVKRLTKFIKD
jgi:topoisomerase IA-like protein